tara:strand:+ start:2097 stop:2345 length:249 start_codon:yes stop_codon:yes gene_type:complete
MTYCEEYQKLPLEKRFVLLKSISDELGRIDERSYPNVYAQLLSAESKRRTIQLIVNAKLQQSTKYNDVLKSIENTLETDVNG